MKEKAVLGRDEVQRTLVRIAHEMAEKNSDGSFVLAGIHTRGAVFARRLKPLVAEFIKKEVPLGELDISFYRDDLSQRGPEPVVHSTKLDFALEGKTVVLVDDVLFTGRTVRAAIDSLFDFGRPDRIQLAVLVDRGHHQLPIRPDYVGKNIPTSLADRVNVRVDEIDGVDEVTISPGQQRQQSGRKEKLDEAKR